MVYLLWQSTIRLFIGKLVDLNEGIKMNKAKMISSIYEKGDYY